MSFRMKYILLVNAVAGVMATLAFAPYSYTWLIFISVAMAFYSWLSLSPRQAWLAAWVYGIALQCSGVGWIYYSLHVHGDSPAPFAFLVIFLLACYLSIYTGLVAWLVNRFTAENGLLRLLLLYPAAWVIFEWMQGYIMTGFAWMQLGYTQIDTPLAGYAPLLGNHAVSGLVAVTAGVLAAYTEKLMACYRRCAYSPGLILKLGVLVSFVWGGGFLLKPVQWTQPTGESLTVSLIQGNIPQAEKWKPSMHSPTLELYRQLTLQQDASVDLIVWPETAVPDYWYGVRDYIRQLRHKMETRDTALLLGIFIKNDAGQLLNSVLNVDGPMYHKRHLVPLGEFIPLRSLIDFFRQWVDIPMSDIASGADKQPLMRVKEVPLGLSICFEDAFARDILLTLPEAQLLVNVSNDAWFEDSRESFQHHTIARVRALESGRFLVRSTNTGISSIIDPKGQVIAIAPHFETAVLQGEVQPMSGSTPFIIWGDTMILLICSGILVFYAVRDYTRSKEMKSLSESAC